jgi:hypothetical protein
MKQCAQCKELKELDHFNKYKNSKDGFNRMCKICSRIKLKTWHLKNPTKQKEYRKEEYIKEYYKNNKSKMIKSINLYNKTHDQGLLYKYNSMKIRCTYPSQYAYRWYGAKGITVEWKSYQEFKKDMYESYLEHLKQHGHKQTTIDRIDANKNYSKENCRWATWKVQVANKKKLSTVFSSIDK